MVMGYTNGQTVGCMRVISNKTKNMGMDHKPGQTKSNTSVTGKKANNMELEFSFYQMEIKEKEYGLKDKNTSGSTT